MVESILRLDVEHFFPHLFAGEPLETRALSSTAFSFAQFLWRDLGSGTRTEWSDQQWQQHLSDITVLFYAAYSQGEPVGAFELNVQVEQVTLTGFGVLKGYDDAGYDQHLLTLAAEKAFSFGRGTLVTAEPVILTSTFRQQGFKQ